MSIFCPKVSVIVPIYNVELYLDRCVTSLLSQTLQDIEIILVDDGSPDQCPQMCDEYASRDQRIKVIHKKNEGLGLARNTGLDVARGEYVAFVDSDDYVDSKLYEDLYAEVTKAKASAAFCGINREVKRGVWVKNKEVETKTVFDKEEVRSFLLDMIAGGKGVKEERLYEMSVWHSIYLKQIIDEGNIRFYSERKVGSEDIIFQTEFLLKSTRIVCIPQHYYYYCLNTSSLTKTINPKKFEAFKNLLKTLDEVTNGETDFHERSQRLFIGYVRTIINHIIDSKQIANKKQIVTSMVNDSIWSSISYPLENFASYYHKIFYYLLIHKRIRLIILLSRLKNKIKK